MIKKIKERIQFAQFCILHRRSLAAQRRWQTKHLQRIVRHAYEHVPLWRTLLDEKGIHPKSIDALEHISKLPVTRKQTFLGRMVEEYIDRSGPVRSIWYITSGTSGIPFRFLMGERALLEKYSDFASLRFLWWRGEPLRALASVNWTRIKIRAPASKHRSFVSVEEFLTDPRRALAKITQCDTAIISAYPSILLEMARLISKDPSLPNPKPRYLLSFGEMLSPSVREFVSETLGCEIYDRYGLEEIGVVGVECAEHDGFHIHTESLILEITDDSYVSVQNGTEGRIVITDLFNYGMPFIRYDTGDRGSVSYEPCACGLRSPRLWLKGRYSAYLPFPQRTIHHLEFDGAMDGFMNYIFQYQIAKKSDTEIIARIIPGPAFYAEVAERVQRSLGKLVGQDIRVDVEIVEVLPTTPRGKSRIVIDESSG